MLEWRPISSVPRDGTLVIGALIRDGKVWRVHEMVFNGIAFYTVSGHCVPVMTHWLPAPAIPPP